MIQNKELRKQLIQNAFERKMTHVGSALSRLDFVNYLYDKILPENRLNQGD